jgi:hypothetical protein
MMFRTLNLVVIALTCLFFGACSSVSTNHLLGDPIGDAQAQKLAGAWNGGDALFFVKPIGDGKVQVGTTKWNDSEQKFTVEQDAMYIRTVGDAMILHTVEQQEKGAASTTSYVLSRIVLSETGEIIFMPPNMKKFVAAVHGGELKGEVSGNHQSGEVDGFMSSDATNVRLTGTKEAIDAYLTADRIALLFTLDGGGVLRRLEGVDID